MLTAYVVVVVVTAVACLWSAAVDLARTRSVLANSAEVGVPPSWLPPLAALKAAGAAGLLLGLLGVPLVGLAAAIGLVLFFVGAVTVHLRARVFHNVGYAGGFLALALACLVLDAAATG
ncbi:DoxX family protein [Plantactinospora endophytica]|uniref:Membrane protein n=1 Tax=Plantactinospora endophytica TaxID=673535 RepID=A0ABQ4E1N0_9ACTN|nr:DoxX family protein [Plantactinospora endophytica]GIG88611.1 membrane protein [Plantactinospora endophytica]